ncbi:hypothetical protein ACIBO5_01540 [Nonomuraea angiospora]|nr:hypothetical protein [Nonomuraea angiospora]MDX3110079.1 hypothetical protein [Nonomuraea angiospora]
MPPFSRPAACGIGWFVAVPTSLTLTVVWVVVPLMMATVLMWRGGRCC